jgi:hypothetical protein
VELNLINCRLSLFLMLIFSFFVFSMINFTFENVGTYFENLLKIFFFTQKARHSKGKEKSEIVLKKILLQLILFDCRSI